MLPQPHGTNGSRPAQEPILRLVDDMRGKPNTSPHNGLTSVDLGTTTPEPRPPVAEDQKARRDEIIAALYQRFRAAARPGEMSDAIQDAAVHFLGRLDMSLPGESRAFYSYFATAVQNKLVDRARSERRRKEREKVASERSADAGLTSSPLTDRIEQEERLRLERALDRLRSKDPQTAQIFDLYHYGGFTQSEVASELGLTRSKVRSGISLAQQFLLEYVSEEHRTNAP